MREVRVRVVERGEGTGRGGEERGGDETPALHAPLIHISGYAPILCSTLWPKVGTHCTR